MEYKFEEYERVINTPKKKMEERTIVEKIISLLNNNKYNSFEDFCSENSDLESFKTNNDLENVLKHFGNKLNQEEYEKILQSLKKMIEKKSTFDDSNIKTKHIDDNEYVSYNGKDEDYYLDNSYSNKSIEEQMRDIQKETPSFQTNDTKENTELIMKEMKEKKKINLILRYLNEINFEILTEEQQEIFKFAFSYQQQNSGLIRIDLDENVMVDENDNIMKIEKIDGKLVINNGDQKYNAPKENDTDNEIENTDEKSKNLSLVKKIDYSNGGGTHE